MIFCFSDSLPFEKPRLIPGAFDPRQVALLTSYGMDLFDGSYVYCLSAIGKGFQLGAEYPVNINDYIIVDLKDIRYVGIPVNFKKLQFYIFMCFGSLLYYRLLITDTPETLAGCSRIANVTVVRNTLAPMSPIYSIPTNYKGRSC